MAEVSFIKQIVLLLLRYLYDNKFRDTCRMLGKESRLYFDCQYFCEQIREGKWGEADAYAGRFTHPERNKYSTKLFFEIRKQKFLEALDRDEKCLAREILLTDLLFLSHIRPDLFYECMSLISLPHFSNNFHLASWKSVQSTREVIATVLAKVLKENPDTKDKLELPEPRGRLESLMQQSWNSQYANCPHFMEDNLRGMTTFLYDHHCMTGSSSASIPWNYVLHQMLENQPPPSPVPTELELGMTRLALSPTPAVASSAPHNQLSELLAATLPSIPEGSIDHDDFAPLGHSRLEVGSSSGAPRTFFGFDLDAGPSSYSFPNPSQEIITVEDEPVDLPPSATGPEVIMEEDDYIVQPPPVPSPKILFGIDLLAQPHMEDASASASAAGPSSVTRASSPPEADHRPARSARRKIKAPARLTTSSKPGGSRRK